MRPLCRALAIVCIVMVTAGAQPATLAIKNARIWTGNPARPLATAIASRGDRIVAVGSDDEVARVSSEATRVIDAEGATVTPGLIDSHIHLMAYNLRHSLAPIFLRFLRGREAVAAKIKALAATLPEGAWILGEDWTSSTWGGPPPAREWLDAIAPQNPVWLIENEGNAGIANSAALREADIERTTPDEPPGAIVRDARGNPTGLIRGGPMWRIEAAIVARTRDQDDRLLQQVMGDLLRMGITSVHHNNRWYDFLALRRLQQQKKLSVRVYASTPLPAWQRLRDYIGANGRGDDWMHWGGLKGFGAIRAEDYNRWTPGASRAGLQIMVHLGSEAELRILLDAFTRTRAELGLKDPRFRLEHAHNLPPDVIPSVVKAGAMVSWQPPLLAHFDQRAASGEPPARHLFSFPSVLGAGIRIAFGTDTYPERELTSPMACIQMAMSRPAPDGSRMSLDQALRAFTIDGAYAEFAEQDKGSLETGKLADFVLFDRDIAMSPVAALPDARVRMTVVGGVPRYEAAPRLASKR